MGAGVSGPSLSLLAAVGCFRLFPASWFKKKKVIQFSVCIHCSWTRAKLLSVSYECHVAPLTKPLSQVNIGSDNGLGPSGNKPSYQSQCWQWFMMPSVVSPWPGHMEFTSSMPNPDDVIRDHFVHAPSQWSLVCLFFVEDNELDECYRRFY